MKRKTIELKKDLVVDGSYENLTSFYQENKKLLYDSILETFSELLSLDQKATINLTFSTCISEERTEISLIFRQKHYIVLSRDLKPYYEEIEDYETCNRILELQKLFTK